MEVIPGTRLDANESAYFSRQLEVVKARSYDVRYPEFTARKYIPVSGEAGAGALAITYQQFDHVGMAKIIASYAGDLPRADIVGKEFTSPIRSIGCAFGYSLQDVRSAAMAGLPLQQRKANAAHRANDQLVNIIGWFGLATAGLKGLLTHPNITTGSVPNGAGGTPQWSTKTSDEILADINAILNGIPTLTNGMERPNTLLLPLAQYSLLATKVYSTTFPTMLMKIVREAHPNVTIESVVELSGAYASLHGMSNVDRMVAYDRTPDKLTLEIPVEFEQLPVQEKGLEYEVPCHSRIGGVIVYYPLSIEMNDSI